VTLFSTHHASLKNKTKIKTWLFKGKEIKNVQYKKIIKKFKLLVLRVENPKHHPDRDER
jgi:hypothetical protein